MRENAQVHKLTNKQAIFAKEYLIDLNATQAAIRAGYAAKRAYAMGHENLKKPDIQAVISEAMAKRAAKTEITSDYVLTTIHDTVERCKQAKPVLNRMGEPVMVETQDGELAPAYTFDASNILKGCELIGKHLGMFREGAKDDDETPAPTRVEIVVQDARKCQQPE